jgi:2-polyprenyl-3-methyl-5-hydroxy-6-metoxy-1,4-benzoquinol methylase
MERRPEVGVDLMIPQSAFDVLQRLLYRFSVPEAVELRQRRYVKFFAQAGRERVVDLGCGRGLFLNLLRQAGIEGVGVDASEQTLSPLRALGLNVVHDDVISFLQQAVKGNEQFGGVFCSHIIEHMPGETGVEMLRLATLALRPGGRLVVITPNFAHPEVSSLVFWLDLTHVRPYPRMLLEAIMEELDMKVVESFDDSMTMRSYLGDWRETRRLAGDLARYGARVLSGMDSVVVAERV